MTRYVQVTTTELDPDNGGNVTLVGAIKSDKSLVMLIREGRLRGGFLTIFIADKVPVHVNIDHIINIEETGAPPWAPMPPADLRVAYATYVKKAVDAGATPLSYTAWAPTR